ncbi:right-handed parallel beta-helix repeat-containing protein [Metabacillus idriensis]|uniref:right-handed parallel beta-helix repeat-containing protein n=1 Tax=Metabacillus idriensis TaxID=324768 RepID=UPI00174A8A39|nr:right-handed parallel beta-helix repeat-containing protein [Metabacillus idriensis]
MNRRNFLLNYLLNFLLWILSFIVGYKVRSFDLKRDDFGIKDKDSMLVSEKIEIISEKLAQNAEELQISTNIQGVSVEKYGAKSDEQSTGYDSTQAFKDNVANAHYIQIPEGTWNLSEFRIRSFRRVKGAGIGKTILKFNGLRGNFVEMADAKNSISKASIEDVTIDCNNRSDVALYLRYLTNGTYLKNIEMINVGKVGVDFSKSWYAQIENVRVRRGGSGDGWYIHDTENQVNSVSFINCQAHTVGGAGFRIKTSHGCTFVSCQAENTQKEAFAIEAGGGSVFIDPYGENNANGMKYPITMSFGTKDKTVMGATVIGGYLLGRPNGVTVKIDKGQNITIIGTEFEVSDSNSRPLHHIQATKNAKGVTVFPSIISNAANGNFDGKISIISNKDNSSVLPYGLKVDHLIDNGLGYIDVQTKLRALNEFWIQNGTSHVRFSYDPTNDVYKVSSVSKDKVSNSKPLLFLNPVKLSKSIEFDATDESNVPKNSMFLDSRDNKLKFKDEKGKINRLY